MRCEDVQDQLALHFGQPTLPADLADHIDSCDSCRAYWEELGGLAGSIPPSKAFEPEPDIAARLAARVNRSLEDLEGRPSPQAARSWWSPWLRPLAAAAAVVLVVGASLTLYRSGLDRDVSDAGSDSAAGQYQNALAMNLDDSLVDAVIYDITSEPISEAGTRLLGDLSQEEFEYLKENFDVGSIL